MAGRGTWYFEDRAVDHEVDTIVIPFAILARVRPDVAARLRRRAIVPHPGPHYPRDFGGQRELRRR
jgi:hypothetical protein